MGKAATTPGVSHCVVSEATWRALASIRHEHLLRDMFGPVFMADAVADVFVGTGDGLPDWVNVKAPGNGIELPQRLVHLRGTDRATIELAIDTKASMTFVEGKALLEKVKLSFIKAMSTVALIVQAYQTGHVRSAKPLLIALERKGHEMPPPEQMSALLRALDELA